MITSTIRDVTEEVAKKSAEAMENVILEQLGILVSEGILVIERREPIITVNSKNIFKVEHKVRLHLKDKEYVQGLQIKIDDLEYKIKHLEEKLESLGNAARVIVEELD